jgi:hypothetical protein
VAGESKEEITPSTKIFFSSDGRKIAFGALKGRELWWKVIEVKP